MKASAHFIEYESISFQSCYVGFKCYALEQELAKTQGAHWTAPTLTHMETQTMMTQEDYPHSDAFHWSRQYEYPKVFWRLVPFKKQKILDAGGGQSIFQFFLSREAPECQITNVDNDEDGKGYIMKAQKFTGFPNLTISLGDILDLSKVYPENYFNQSFSISVLEHLKSWDERKRAILELVKVTKESVFITMDVISKKINDIFVPDESFLAMMRELGIRITRQNGAVVNSMLPDNPKPDEVLLIMFISIEKDLANTA